MTEGLQGLEGSLFRREAVDAHDGTSGGHSTMGSRSARTARTSFRVLVTALLLTAAVAYFVHVDETTSGLTVAGPGKYDAVVYVPASVEGKLTAGMRVRLQRQGGGTVPALLTQARSSVIAAQLPTATESALRRAFPRSTVFAVWQVRLHEPADETVKFGSAVVVLDRLRLLDVLLPSFLYQ